MSSTPTLRKTFARRTSSSTQDELAAKCEVISTKYGAPANRRGTNTGSCVSTPSVPHGTSKCCVLPMPERKNTWPSNALKARWRLLPTLLCPQIRLHRVIFFRHSTSENEEGSKLLCPVVQAYVPHVGSVMAFPDSGSNITVVTAALVSAGLTPWTKSCLVAVVGGSVHPYGLRDPDITVEAISAGVSAVVLENNICCLSF